MHVIWIDGVFFWLWWNLFFIDTTAPVVSGCPGNMNLGRYTVITHNRPSVSDNSRGIKTFEVSPRNANTTLVLEETPITITYTAKDFNGNQDSCSFTVNVAGVYFLSENNTVYSTKTLWVFSNVCIIKVQLVVLWFFFFSFIIWTLSAALLFHPYLSSKGRWFINNWLQNICTWMWRLKSL